MFFEVSAKCTLPLGRDLLIRAARLRARGVSWALIAEETACSEGELLTFSIDRPEIWGPLYERAEKLRLQEAEGQGLAHLTALLKGNDEAAAEKAARELLLHRRHIERRRNCNRRCTQIGADSGSDRGGAPEVSSGSLSAEDYQRSSASICGSKYPEFLVEEPVPGELQRPVTYAANRVAHGEDYASIAREVGHDAEQMARWAFIYPRTWDRVYPQARLAAARFSAALAINRLLDLAAGPDADLAARAGRTLLVHRRHMHWRLPERHLACPTGGASLARTTPGGRHLTICQGGQETSFSGETQDHDSAGTYPSSVTQVSVAIPGDGSLTVARRSGPARSSGAVRPSASARARDGP